MSTELGILGNLVWVLPRPRMPYYKGGFPLHFEKRLWRLLGKPNQSLVLHPFGGMAEIGVRCDIKADTNPDYVCDAHNLPFSDESYQIVICDPPYSNEENKTLYGNQGELHFAKWVAEASRVCKPNGFVVLYHDRWLPKPPKCSYWMRIIVMVSQHHRGRICSIYQKDEN
ncbi:MAG: hypothetical protein WC365_07945 [Candidatus Babeliales bacterium]